MKLGDLVYDTFFCDFGIITAVDYTTDIGTPFDYEVLYLTSGEKWGADENILELITDERKKLYLFT
jgi:hypothetical protein